MKPAPKKVRERKVKAYVVVHKKLDVWWANLHIGFCAVFPLARIAKRYVEEELGDLPGTRVVPCTISFSVPKIIRTKKTKHD